MNQIPKNKEQDASKTEKSIFEHAIYEQEHQFELGIKNLKNEIETIFKAPLNRTSNLGNRIEHFFTRKSRFQ